MANIFDGIVRRENDYTQLLRNVMERSPILTGGVFSYLLGRQLDRSEIAKLQISTQLAFHTETGREIPDLVIQGEQLRCLLEIKVDPYLGLTRPQECGYAGCFDDIEENHLVFLVPDGWRHRGQVDRIRCEAKPNLTVQPVRAWGDLVRKMHAVSLTISDPPVSEAIDFLMNSFGMTQMNSDEKSLLREWNTDAYSAFRKLQRTVDQAKKIFAAESDYEVEGESLETNAYGFYVKESGRYRLWVGIWTDAPFPLVFGYRTDSRSWRIPRNPPPESFLDKGRGGHRLWQVSQEAWDSPELLFEQVRQFLAGSQTDLS